MSAGKFIGGMLIGAAVGAAVALLNAPQDGATTRKQLRTKLDKLEDELISAKEKLKKAGTDAQDSLKHKVESIESKIEEILAKYKKAEKLAK